MPKKKTHEEFVNSLKDVSSSISVIGKYSNTRTKVLVQCNICGYQWLAGPSDLLRGHGCPRCSKKERKTPSRFREEVLAINPNLEVIGEYVNTSTKVTVRCRTCGYSWNANPSTLLHGNGCPSCGGTRKITQIEFINRLAVVNPDIEVIGEYKNNRTKVLVHCKRCGLEWSATPHTVIMYRREDLLLLMQKDIRILENFTTEVASAAYMLQQRLELLSYNGIAQKAACYLLMQQRKTGTEMIPVPGSISKWAMIMNVSRTSLHRELKKLESQGIINIMQHKIQIIDPSALQEVLSD